MILYYKKCFIWLLLLVQLCAFGIDPDVLVLYESDGRPVLDYSEKITALIENKKIVWPVILDFGNGRRFTVSSFVATGNVTAVFEIVGNSSEVLRIPKSTKTYRLGKNESSPPAGLNPFQDFDGPYLGQRAIGPWQENNVLVRINQDASDRFRFHLMEKIQVDFSLKDVIHPLTDMNELYKKSGITEKVLTDALTKLGEDLSAFSDISDFHDGQVVWDHNARKFRLLDHSAGSSIASFKEKKNVLNNSLFKVREEYVKTKKNLFDESVIKRITFVIDRIERGIKSQRATVTSDHNIHLINSMTNRDQLQEDFAKAENIKEWDAAEKKMQALPELERVFIWQELGDKILNKKGTFLPVTDEATWKYWIDLANNPPIAEAEKIAVIELDRLLTSDYLLHGQRAKILDLMLNSENPFLQKYAMDGIFMTDTEEPLMKKNLARLMNHSNEKISEMASIKFKRSKFAVGDGFILGVEIFDRFQKINFTNERYIIPDFNKKETIKKLLNHSEGRVMLMAMSANKRDAALGRILLAARDRPGPMPELYKYLRNQSVSVQDLGNRPLQNIFNNCLKVFGL